MTNKAKYIIKTLDDLFPNPPIPLNHSDDYTLLVAVLLSTQCTDKRVNQITPKLFSLADNPQKMAKIPVNSIKEIIKPCGLSNKKAQAIKDLSQILCEKFNSEVPNTLQELETLPGVGHKTASVVCCQAFNIPAFPVDTHIHRLAKRWNISNGKNVKTTESDLKKFFPKKHWIKLHLQIIYYARKYCSAYSCDGFKCQICNEINK